MCVFVCAVRVDYLIYAESLLMAASTMSSAGKTNSHGGLGFSIKYFGFTRNTVANLTFGKKIIQPDFKGKIKK